MSGVICYLLINKIPKLPKLAIESALKNTQSDIFIGYLKESDLFDLPKNSRIHFVDLNVPALHKNLMPDSAGYISFDENFFFQLVQLKWDLFQSVLSNTNADFLVYLDMDVVVLKDLVTEFEKTFQTLPNVDVLVQDFTHGPSDPRLCMGVFALRNNPFSQDLVKKCAAVHGQNLVLNPRFGDDDVITEVYQDWECSKSFVLLPQQSFPVGNLINLFLPFSPLRGLRPSRPFIFHSNFVVGVQKKALLLEMVSRRKGLLSAGVLVRSYFCISLDFSVRKIRRVLEKSVRGIRGT